MKVKFKIIITFLVIIIFSLLILIYYKNEQKSVNVDEFAKFRSEQCKEGEIMNSWDTFGSGKIVVNECTIPYRCKNGKIPKGYCGALGDRASCGLSCIP